MNEKPWKKCQLCPNEHFDSPYQFGDHLRTLHSKKEGGSHICLFGPNGICPTLPIEGVNDRDYESHIAKSHIFSFEKANHNHSSGKSSKFTDNINHEQSSKSNHMAKSYFLNTFPNPSKNGFLHKYFEENGYLRDNPNVIDQDEWTIYSSSQNLTSALNDPFKSRSYYDNLFTKDWGFNFVDPIMVAPFPTSKKPSQMLFENYIKKVNKRNQIHRSQSQTNQVGSKQDGIPYEESVALQMVPTIFFDPNFNLENNEIFTNLLCLFGSKQNDDNLETFFNQHSMNDIQKSLSEYLDVVEQDLAQQICKRSKDFFLVMSSMDMVMEKLKLSIRQVSQIRDNCTQLEQNLVRPIEQNIELTQLRDKYRDLNKKINWIATVHQTQPTIQLLLSKNDFAGALDLISTSQEVVAQELSGVISFRHLKLQLMEIEKVIEQMMNEEFVKYLTAEWNRPITVDSSDYIKEERLLSIIYGMLKLQKFNFIDTFREEAFTAIKTNVKQTVIEAVSSDDSIEVSRIDVSLYEQTRFLKILKWLNCLESLFNRLAILLKRVNLVYNVINNGFMAVANNSIVNHSNDSNHLNSTNEELNLKIILQSDHYELSANLKEILCSICDFAHTQCAHIIEMRVNDGSLDRLNPIEFVRLIQLIENFVNQCETICGKKSPNLKLVIQIQSNKFVTKFHDERKNNLKGVLDLEKWVAVNSFSKDFETLCIELVNEKSNLMAIYTQYKSSKSITSKSSSNYITLNGEKFVLIPSVISLVHMVLEYCEYAQQITFLSQDLMLRLIELLKFFNSRTAQLVLGAEALQIAGLNTISARTLITSYRSLTFVLNIVPPIRRHFETLFTTVRQANMLKHFDEIQELYENHQCKIPEEVVSMVKNLINSLLQKWIAKPPVPSASFQSICQHLHRLHDNIHDFMPHQQLITLFERIHHTLITSFRERLEKLKIINDGGPQHGLVTQELTFYIQSLSKLSIGTKLNLNTTILWTNKLSP
ncbi:hypothetical protein RDWZM_004793 [Blomia tropicalis]|uniref:Vacuolar protein sorting-associated protein 54 n=1 Tax=Blomia tropicalis TaxID=40697 RepID=A0A9Q0RMX2_BLOTA|nr:hypothetical protein RDWZM_004793 [Blomia tropicalis]